MGALRFENYVTRLLGQFRYLDKKMKELNPDSIHNLKSRQLLPRLDAVIQELQSELMILKENPNILSNVMLAEIKRDLNRLVELKKNIETINPEEWSTRRNKQMETCEVLGNELRTQLGFIEDGFLYVKDILRQR